MIYTHVLEATRKVVSPFDNLEDWSSMAACPTPLRCPCHFTGEGLAGTTACKSAFPTANLVR